MSNRNEGQRIDVPPVINEATRPEKTPEHSTEVLAMVEQIDGSIETSDDLLGGLGRLARRRIMLPEEARNEIYAPEETRKGIKNKKDANYLEYAEAGLEARNAIKRILTLGLSGSKYAIKDERGNLSDKRILAEGYKGKTFELRPDELAEVAERAGLKPEEVKPTDVSKTYVEGNNGLVEIKYTRQRTAEEKDKVAGEILTRQLNKLSSGAGLDPAKDKDLITGPKLIEEKKKLAEFKRQKEQTKDVLDADSLTRLEEEEKVKQAAIDEKQEELNNNLEVFRAPLVERQSGLAEVLTSLSSLLAETTVQEKAYETQVKGLQDKIRKVKGNNQIAEILGDKITEWEEEKAQAEVNSNDFKAKKAALKKRIDSLKISKAAVDTVLTKVNNIGKTQTDLREEREKKLQEEKDAKEAAKQAAAVTPPTPAAAAGQPAVLPGPEPKPADPGEFGDEAYGADDLAGKAVSARPKSAPAVGMTTGELTDENYGADDLGGETVKSKVANKTMRNNPTVDKLALDQDERERESEEIDRLANETVEERQQGTSEADDNLAEDEDSEGWIKRAAAWLGIKKPRRQAGPENVAARVQAAEAPVVALEPGREEGEGTERREVEVIRSTRFWLNTIFGGKLRGPKKEIMKRNFKVQSESEDELKNPMTAEKAQKAYAGYIVDLKKAGIIDLESSEAPWDEAHRAIKDIIEHIDDYSEDGVAIKPGGNAVVQRQEGVGGNERIDLKLTAEELKGIYSPEKAEVLAQAQTAKAGALEQAKTEAVEGNKLEGEGEERPANKNRAARKLRKEKLKEADLEGDEEPVDEKKRKKPTEIRKKVEEEPKVDVIEGSPINGLDTVFEQAMVKPEKPVDAPASAEPAAKMGATRSGEAVADQPEKAGKKEIINKTEFTTKELLEILDLKVNDTVKGHFVSPKNRNQKFNKRDLWTKSQAIEAGVAFLLENSHQPEDEVRKKVNELFQ